MARVRVATLIMVAVLFTTGRAHAQQRCAPGGCTALDLIPDPELPDSASVRQAYGLLVGGTAVGITTYVLGLLVAGGQTHRLPTVDALPVVGPIVSAARNAGNERAASFLSFAGAAQAMSLLVISAAATDLLERRRMLFNVAAGPDGCSASVTFRLP